MLYFLEEKKKIAINFSDKIKYLGVLVTFTDKFGCRPIHLNGAFLSQYKLLQGKKRHTLLCALIKKADWVVFSHFHIQVNLMKIHNSTPLAPQLCKMQHVNGFLRVN